MPKKELKRTLSFKELNIKSEEKRKQPNSTRNHSAKDLNFPDLNQLIELSLKGINIMRNLYKIIRRIP